MLVTRHTDTCEVRHRGGRACVCEGARRRPSRELEVDPVDLLAGWLARLVKRKELEKLREHERVRDAQPVSVQSWAGIVGMPVRRGLPGGAPRSA